MWVYEDNFHDPPEAPEETIYFDRSFKLDPDIIGRPFDLAEKDSYLVYDQSKKNHDFATAVSFQRLCNKLQVSK